MNNLHIDLILDSERRSASPVSMKMIVRLVIGIVIISIILSGSLFAVKLRMIKSELIRVQEEWATIQPKQTRAQKDQKTLKRYQTMLQEINSWTIGSIDWSERLLVLQKIVPKDIQLISMVVDDAIATQQGLTAWLVTVELRGRARGDDPKASVDAFVRGLKKTADIKGAEVVAKSFIPDKSKGALRHHRTFKIQVIYRSQLFHYETPKR